MSPLKGEALKAHLEKLGSSWSVKGHHLEKEYKFKDFKEALAFVNKVGRAAEAQGHHPDIELGWGKVKILLWTHDANGLTEKDFRLAEKCDEQ